MLLVSRCHEAGRTTILALVCVVLFCLPCSALLFSASRFSHLLSRLSSLFFFSHRVSSSHLLCFSLSFLSPFWPYHVSGAFFFTCPIGFTNTEQQTCSLELHSCVVFYCFVLFCVVVYCVSGLVSCNCFRVPRHLSSPVGTGRHVFLSWLKSMCSPAVACASVRSTHLRSRRHQPHIKQAHVDEDRAPLRSSKAKGGKSYISAFLIFRRRKSRIRTH